MEISILGCSYTPPLAKKVANAAQANSMRIFSQQTFYLSSLQLSKLYSLFNTYSTAGFLLPDLSHLIQL